MDTADYVKENMFDVKFDGVPTKAILISRIPGTTGGLLLLPHACAIADDTPSGWVVLQTMVMGVERAAERYVRGERDSAIAHWKTMQQVLADLTTPPRIGRGETHPRVWYAEPWPTTHNNTIH